MDLTKNAPELLMPAGDFEKLKLAFAYGADAVYAGVPFFSLRARENEFRAESVRQGIEYAHNLGKRIYLTMNIYAHNSRVDKFLDAFAEMADLQPDGFIMTDIGLIAKARKLRPNAVIHLSTQANATNWTSVEFYRDLGLRRVILSRELSIKEIAEIHAKVPEVELEAFVHGSICIAYSGRCLISNYVSHRDANQGTCTNSCRWQYKLGLEQGSLVDVEERFVPVGGKYTELSGDYYVTEENRKNQKFPIDEDEHGTYLMNSKDLCAIELLKELRDAGVCSFKVEGRHKSIYYLGVVTRAYRKAIDDLMAGKPFDKQNLYEVLTTASRTLMTGFLLKRPEQYGQNFEDGCSLPLSHRFAGIVRSVDGEKQLALVESKNKLKCGDTLEWLRGADIETTSIVEMYNETGEPITEIHGGGKFFIAAPSGVDQMTLIRTPL